ncbi:phytanoyl-CoA dioxygenase family protein [Actinopolymorpha rutila]|uniref:Ectoine hydroxylase-related dioxygenase (Phytanoyl-CoA dioxygenase family) n=1 Tax=Actinopolymorpha rutila TaxID=446787 RepID=A0A852ZM93_9ACTN|nr:phytanoyl-CoA dioxygenase family protein [Actinopolymorpha rutila]NYH93393.1 ectoine hydroxylase-related dioxygenase (phytanoyl-CoA dioxygenase family) [Actinopolymorpha rutila]
MTATVGQGQVLTDSDAEFFWERGYLRVPQVFTSEETAELKRELDRLILEWANRDSEWTGPWRQAYMDEETERAGKFAGMHDLQYYSAPWLRAISNPRLVAVLSKLLGPDVEFHHTTMHVKVPETGMPFPMHQDHPFYKHDDGRFIDVLLHLDDTNSGNGEIRFLEGSHQGGALQHITETEDGPCSPHLPMDDYRLADTVPVPANAGDVVLMTINTVHGSDINRSSQPRRLVRMGYRHPHNRQTAGQSLGRAGLMVAGNRERREGDQAFPTE